MTEWTEKIIGDRFEEAVVTLERLPLRTDLGYHRHRTELVYEPYELARQEPGPTRLKATPAQISRMEETLTWITWIQEGYRKIVWLRAYRYSWREIARITGFPKSTAQRHWNTALQEVVQRLKAERCVA